MNNLLGQTRVKLAIKARLEVNVKEIRDKKPLFLVKAFEGLLVGWLLIALLSRGFE